MYIIIIIIIVIIINSCLLQIPLPINKINNDDHPVEVGLADSFYVDVVDRFGRKFI